MGKTLPKFGPYNVIADTNALYARDSRKLVSAGFEAALVEVRKVATVQLFVPHVIIGELAFQKFIAASAAIADANAKLNILSDITGVTSPRICSTSQAKAKIVKRYEAWCKTVMARRFVPKIKQAAWCKLVEDAIWRIPPFEHSEDGKHEKGFRDRVVLESVLQLCSGSTTETVLLTADGLLSKAVGACGIKNLTVVPRLEDFTSRVRLLKEEQTKEWVDTFFDAATRAFYEESNQDCLYWREKIPTELVGRVEDLKPPLPPEPLLAALGPKVWERQTDERISLGTTQFERVENGRILWKTEVSLAAAFSGQDLFSALEEKIRISTFECHWSSEGNTEAEIRNPRFKEISLVDRQMVSDSAELRAKWALPAKPLPVPRLADLFGNLPKPTAK